MYPHSMRSSLTRVLGRLGWLRTHVHGLAAKVPVQDLLKGATGKPCRPLPSSATSRPKYLESAASSAAAVMSVDTSDSGGSSGVVRRFCGEPSRTLQRLQAELRGSVGKAIEDFGMIVAGDRVMVASRAERNRTRLLDILLSLSGSAPASFELIAFNLIKATRLPGGGAAEYLQSLGVLPHYRAGHLQRVNVSSPRAARCAVVSRLRRGALYRFAAENGITKIALGHHRDDIVERCS